MVVSQGGEVREWRPSDRAMGDRAKDRAKDGPLQEYDVRTCRAAAGCPRAVADVGGARDACEAALLRVDAGAALRAKAEGPFREHHRLKVAVSGCPNQCSQPQIADVGLVGQRFPRVDQEACIACGLCVEACAESALSLIGGELAFDRSLCEGCGSCIAVCPTMALAAAEEGWRVLVGGRLGRHPRLAAEVEACAPLGRAIDHLEVVVGVYVERGHRDERVGAALDRLAGAAAGTSPAADEDEASRARALACLLRGIPATGRQADGRQADGTRGGGSR